MATSIEAQLQAIRASLRGREDLSRRPVTRPSVLFDPREAADIDLRTILPIAISGLDVLVVQDARFGSYRSTLFSHTSLDLDREKMEPKDELKVNKSVSSYLRLLSGYVQLPAALKTLEYLIRRFRVHVFNAEDLILCALPHHDTHAFVRIVQLLEFGNNKWGFLEAVKSSGAPPPRKVIVQQCIRDKGVLEALCNYALPTKVFCHSKVVVCFCTAVIVEALGATQQLDDDTVKRVIPFIFSGLNPEVDGGQDSKAGALMVVGLVASRATLSPKLSNNLLYVIGRMVQQDAKELSGVPWLHMALMTIVNIVQTQSLSVFPKKALKCLIEIRDFAVVVKSLSQEFNITKFLLFFLEALIDYSPSDVSCCRMLSTIIETVPMEGFIDTVASKVLSFSVRWARSVNINDLPEAGSWVKQILIAIDRTYPSEWRGALRKFLENSKIFIKEEDDVTKTLSLIIDGSLDMPLEISDSKIWFALEHPKSVVRRAALSGLSASRILEKKDTDARKLINVRDAILRCLQDDDLSVVQAALSIDGLAGIINLPLLLKAFRDLLIRCFALFKTGTSDMICKASEVTVSCLEFMVSNFYLPESSCSREVATMIFPFLLVLPKTWKINLKALELAKDLKWPFYSDSFVSYSLPFQGEMQELEPSDIISINRKTVGVMATTFLKNPELHIKWLTECCSNFQESSNLFMSLLLQAILIHKSLLKLFQVCQLALKQEWQNLIAQDCNLPLKEFSIEKLNRISNEFTKGRVVSISEVPNGDIFICIYWSLLKAFSGSPQRVLAAGSGEWLSILEDLFVFFVTSSAKHAFKEHILFLVKKCCPSPPQFLSGLFTTEGFPTIVQVQSLLSLSTICSISSTQSNVDANDKLQFLICFPSLLIRLSDENKDMRIAAMECMEELYKLLQHFDASSVKNGNDYISTSCFGEFVGLIISQKILILSDANFLSSFLASVFVPSQRLMVSQDIDKRFDQQVKETFLTFVLASGLKLSSYGKIRVLALFKRLGNSMLKVKEVKVLLDELLNKRKQYYFGRDPRSCDKLSETEIQILCLLLEISLMVPRSGGPSSDSIDCLIEALKVDGKSLEEPGIKQPCIAILRSLTSSFYGSLSTEMQEELFGNLVFLYRSDDDDIRNATKEALTEINVSCSTIAKFLQVVRSQGHQTASSKIKRKKQSVLQTFLVGSDSTSRGKILLLSSILDILLLKKDMEKRETLVDPLFKLLRQLMHNDWEQGLLNDEEKLSDVLPDVPETVSEAVSYIQQAILVILQDITDSVLSGHHLRDEFVCKFNIRLLVAYAQSTKDTVTLNLIFSLLSSAAKISSQWVSEHIFELFSIIGYSAARQNDSHSRHVTEELISALVPCWLSTSNNIKNLLQVFVNVLPEIIEDRRLALTVHLLRTLGEKSSLGVLVALLFHMLAARKSKSFPHGIDMLSPASSVQKEWEYSFAVKIFDQYSCRIWLPSLVVLLQEMGTESEHESFSELHLAFHFILQKLQDTGFIFTVESEGDSDYVQSTLRVLMEQVILHLKVIDSKGRKLGIHKNVRKQLKESIRSIVKCISEIIAPSQFFSAIGQLVGDDNSSVKKKALRLLCQTIKNRSLVSEKHRVAKEAKKSFIKPYIFIDESSTESFCELCSKIVQLVDEPNDNSPGPVRLAAVSSLEVLAKAFPTSDYISTSCLVVVAKHITSDNLTLSSTCLQSTGALISVLGSKMLSVLPFCMKHVFERARDAVSSERTSIFLPILGVLEVVVENLGGFLNPYLEGILELMVLHPEYASESDHKVKAKAALLRKLIAEKIPARLLLTPLMKVYKETLNCGEISIALAFEILANMVASMDKSSVGSYHAKIFEQCFLALDLRRQHPDTIKNVDLVEDNVIHAITALTVKLTESMFRPLFIHCIDWAESDIEASDSTNGVLCRKISFYKLVNKLTEQHRSLFVPFFKYLIDGCVRYLTDGQAVQEASFTKKRKKAKVGKCALWHLRSLILSSLYKCFLYDTGNLKFLESSNFQALLKPIVSQLLVDPPVSSEQYQNLPAVDEVDESLVCCLGQMAVTVGSDDIWKQLNHEVLMQTRCEKVRARILGLRVIKYLVEHLKEEYLVCLPETIPFLSELLEDVEFPIKSLAQEFSGSWNLSVGKAFSSTSKKCHFL
ncbi:unnamed protein product [Spirodela intermedia]|uniref:BP28 C-terminal domain-containing protein n=1 Tax=Spirodela intermedia TaxID=51605 RepID=A0A7I8J016_SPIIN|nr:unnamed protein product [Spirodela intermedia]CAA6663312.1 unnamed protein product [Spirodela intermedia]